eukprot:3268484-Pyramimonas_sp.AAC.1
MLRASAMRPCYVNMLCVNATLITDDPCFARSVAMSVFTGPKKVACLARLLTSWRIRRRDSGTRD